MTPSSTSTQPEPATSRLDKILTDTDVGSVFVSNYPPYSFWNSEQVKAAAGVLQAPLPNGEATDLGLYLHIPFCRKRCKFCYFRVYVDKNADQIQQYLDALVREIEIGQALANFRTCQMTVREARPPGMSEGRRRFESEGVGLRRHLAIPPDTDPRLA